jgi:hypothetical protein
MNTGALRSLVTLDTPNGANGYLPLDPPTWPCAQASQGTGQAMLLTGRFHPGINTATRVHFADGRIFHVDSVINRDERDVELVVACREVFE